MITSPRIKAHSDHRIPSKGTTDPQKWAQFHHVIFVWEVKYLCHYIIFLSTAIPWNNKASPRSLFKTNYWNNFLLIFSPISHDLGQLTRYFLLYRQNNASRCILLFLLPAPAQSFCFSFSSSQGKINIGQPSQIRLSDWFLVTTLTPLPWPAGLTQKDCRKLLMAAKWVATVSWRGILSSQHSISHLVFYGTGVGAGLVTSQRRAAEWWNHASPQHSLPWWWKGGHALGPIRMCLVTHSS